MLQVHHNPYQNPNRLFCQKWQADPNIYMEMRRAYNRQNNFRKEENWGNYTT